MESLRRPTVLAAIAAAVLAINVIVLTAVGGGSDEDGADPAASPAVEDGEDGGTDAGQSGDTPVDGTEEQPAEDGADGATGEEQADGGGEDAGEAADPDADDGGDADGGALGVPAAGTYAYASAGTWRLTGGEQPEEYELPASSTGTVQADGDAWQVRLEAGERYADRFGFALVADGGLDWGTWVLERQFSSGRSETSYSCSGDAPFYVPGEQGRVVEHDCESDAGIVSDGQVEHLGSEDVTLGDGTVITADRLLYTYTVSGSGTTPGGDDFEASGEGRLDLWVDPATGLRVREQRSISTTNTFSSGGTLVYDEDVEFTLQSTQPS